MKRSDLTFFIAKGEKRWWDIPASEQRQYIEGLKEPKDDVERSYAQYRCQTFFVPIWKRYIRNIVALLVLPIMILVYLVKGFFVKKSEPVDAIGHFKEYPEILPNTLKQEYDINCELWADMHILLFSDLFIIIGTMYQYCIHPYFFFKCLYNISKYSYFIKRYTPKAIIDHAEYSCTSSALTAYCNRRGIQHINVMHGEKMFYIRDSFFRYDRCYIWDEYYKNLFLSLRAAPGQFIIEKPRVFHIDIDNKRDMKYYADYKYYLQVPDVEEMKSILDSMKFAKKLGLSVKYRLHPNHMNDEAFKIIPKEDVENPHDVDIETSMASCNNVVGSYTTVLVQAYFSGINVIMDDVTYQSRYNQLKEFKYVLSNTNVKRLSECQ